MAAVVSALLLVAACGDDGDDLGLLEVALLGCFSDAWLDGNDAVRLGDGGDTLTVQTEGEERDGVAVSSLGCVLDDVGVPSYVRERMAATSSLDGQQEADWVDPDGRSLSASWDYHPDDGMRVTFHVEP